MRFVRTISEYFSAELRRDSSSGRFRVRVSVALFLFSLNSLNSLRISSESVSIHSDSLSPSYVTIHRSSICLYTSHFHYLPLPLVLGFLWLCLCDMVA